MRIVMTQAKTCHRILVISGSAPEYKNAGNREPIPARRTTGERIVIIRDRKLVGG
jgi:hypothetical protein